MSRAAFEDRLLRLYRRYIGEPDQKRDVYVGFGLFFGGVALGVLGLVLFLIERGVAGGGAVWWLREVAFAIAALGLPAVLLGVVVLLPVDRGPLYVAGAGTLACLVAVAIFVSVYPRHWNVIGARDYSTLGVTVYAAGLVAVVGSTGAALVSYQIERAAPAAGVDGRGAEQTETVTDEQVQSDIEEAMANTELSWGGVEKREGRSLEIASDTDIEDADRTGFDGAAANEYRSESVDEAVTGLKHLRGGENRQDRSRGGVDDQASALKELRQQKRREEAQGSDGYLDRVRGFFGLD